MNYILIIFKGFLIGVAKIIPGISGSVLALALGVYERVLNIVSNIKEITLKDINYLFWLIVGILFGISVFAGIIKFLLHNYFVLTTSLFIGMIAGGVPALAKKTRFNIHNLVLFMIAFSFIFLTELLGSNFFDIKINGQLYLGMGIVEAFTTLIPGISGTAIFMALGWYDVLLDLFTGIGLFKTNILYLLLFISGFIVFGLIIMKVINYFLMKFKCETYSVILGFMMGSLCLIFKNLIYIKFTVFEGIVSIILFIIGLYMNKIIKYS